MPIELVHDPDLAPFNPYPGGQADAWADVKSKYLYLPGGWGSGKTTLGAAKLLDVHLHNAFYPNGNPTGCPSAVIGPTRALVLSTQYEELRAIGERMGLTLEFRNSMTVNKRRFSDVIYLHEISSPSWPSMIFARPAERPELITGWQVGAAWGDEVTRWREDHTNPKRDPLVQMEGRVRHPAARHKLQIFTYTNEGDGTRIYEEANKPRPTRATYTLKTRDNPQMTEYADRLAEQLSPDMAEQYLEGGAMKLRGAAVYYSYQANRHQTSDIGFDSALPLCLAFDFNIAPGMHIIIGQKRGSVFTAVDEIHEEHWACSHATEAFVQRYSRFSFPAWKTVRIYGDASGNARSTQTGETNWQIARQILERAGYVLDMRVPSVNPAVIDRTNAVNIALQNQQVLVHPRCTRLATDLLKQKRNAKGEIDKTSDPTIGHASDAFGYWLHADQPIRTASPDRAGRIGAVPIRIAPQSL